MIFKENDKLLFIGDSITDCKRKRPIGESLINDGLGLGYVSLIASLIETVYPKLHIGILNQGISGNTIRDVKSRWENDVLQFSPDWISIMIGINDVWQQFDSLRFFNNYVYENEYRATLDELVKTAKSNQKGIILMTPYFIENNSEDLMRKKMNVYASIVKEISKKHNTLFVDTQQAFDEVLKDMHPTAIAWDRIHPTTAGHMIIARAFLKSVDFVF
jgi:lysophospholipase L1-like esterase